MQQRSVVSESHKSPNKPINNFFVGMLLRVESPAKCGNCTCQLTTVDEPRVFSYEKVVECDQLGNSFWQGPVT